MELSYYNKYLKYKTKYIYLKIKVDECNSTDNVNNIDNEEISDDEIKKLFYQDGKIIYNFNLKSDKKKNKLFKKLLVKLGINLEILENVTDIYNSINEYRNSDDEYDNWILKNIYTNTNKLYETFKKFKFNKNIDDTGNIIIGKDIIIDKSELIYPGYINTTANDYYSNSYNRKKYSKSYDTIKEKNEQFLFVYTQILLDNSLLDNSLLKKLVNILVHKDLEEFDNTKIYQLKLAFIIYSYIYNNYKIKYNKDLHDNFNNTEIFQFLNEIQ